MMAVRPNQNVTTLMSMKGKTDTKPMRRLSFETMRTLMDEHGQETLDGVFLKNDIAMVRSVKSLIKTFGSEEPFYLDDARLGIVRKGGCRHLLNLMETDLNEGDVVYIGRGSILQIGSMTEDFDVTGVAFDDDQLNVAFNGRPPSLFQQYACHRVLHASKEEHDIFSRYMDALWAITQLPYDTRRLAGQSVGPLLSLFELCLEHQEERKPEQVSHRREVFNRFVRLVNEHVQEAHTLDYYANHLCLTARYLGAIVKSISGETAKAWIDRALVSKAKVMLRHTDRQVAEVADTLGFPTSSFFCRYFRERTGCTPQEYRNG